VRAVPTSTSLQSKLAAALEFVRLGETERGEALLRQVVSDQPANAEALMHLGLLTLRTGRITDAERLFTQMSQAAPTSPAAFNGHGIALAGLGRLEEALARFDQALSLNPRDPNSWANRGLALTDMLRLEDALDSFEKALVTRPHFPAVHNNAGLALHRLGRFQEAIVSFDKAIAADSNDTYAHFNRSLSLLALGDYERGWDEYEWRWKSALAHVKRDFPAPLWRNDFPVDGKTILVHAEQGLGDSLQFCRYVPMLAAIATVVLVVPKSLTQLLAGLAQTVTTGEALPRFDAWIPMMSLPLAFRTTVATIPHAIPYLYADPERTAAWRERLGQLPGRKVGLVWSGAPRPEDPRSSLVDRRRSIKLQYFAPFVSVRNMSFVSLQKGEAAVQARNPPAGMVLHDWSSELDDFADTAALIEALDLVVSVDTSAAHLAGALGRPVWVLNRYDQCWRWLAGRTDSPWYPSARLFQQKTLGDWAGVIQDVTAALHASA
jgi:tetratricopeptide (TPR) repeat protein